jgi:2-C-methyl-D-erythritol 4-phosphate cytidylyltransferase
LPPDVGVVVVAAGRGDRIGGDVPKQFLPIAGVPLLLHALRPFLSHPAVAQVVVVLPAPIAASPPEWLAPLLGERLRAVSGGKERMDSVEAGLNGLPSECSIVLVHDGARPFPDPRVIGLIIDEARRGAGAIAAMPMTDTLKIAERRTYGALQRIAKTLPRDGVWRAQTPQGFPRSMLEAAYADARALEVTATDCAALVERVGGEVVLVADVATNLKVTTPGDLALARALAESFR